MGFLYLFHDTQHYKVGITRDVRIRIGEIQTGNPNPITCMRAYEFDDASPVEKAIHSAWASRNKSGEWFTLTEQDIETFDQICALLGGKKTEVKIIQQDAPTGKSKRDTPDCAAAIMNMGISHVIRSDVGDVNIFTHPKLNRIVIVLPAEFCICSGCDKIRARSQMNADGTCSDCWRYKR